MNFIKYNVPKMSLAFILFVIIAKIIYLLFESYYNGYIIDVVTTSNVTKDVLKQIEGIGNKISSVGLTLLILPVYYLLVKKPLAFHAGVRGLVLLAMSILTFFAIHRGLYYAVDKIIENHKDKRYESYYIGLFKYGMLTKKLGYSSFIPKKNLEHLSIEDKVLITNLFLLTQFDPVLIKKLVDIGQDEFFDIYVDKYFQDNYYIARTRFEDYAKKVDKQWKLYSANMGTINRNMGKLESKKTVSTQYNSFVIELKQMYKDYRKNVDTYTKVLGNNQKLASKAYKDFDGIFNKKGKIRDRARYEQLSKKHFNSIVKKEDITQKGEYPSMYKIVNVIDSISLTKFKSQNKNLSINLSQREYYKNQNVKDAVISNLRSKGVAVEDNFNYSKKEFTKAYLKTTNKKFRSSQWKFKKEFEKKTGFRNVKVGMNYKEFVHLYKREIFSMYKDKSQSRAMYNMILNKDLTNFYEKIYRPLIKTKYYDQAFPVYKDFEVKYAEYGDKAIKLLYIPPFAIATSLFAGVLNSVSVVVMILFLIVYRRESILTLVLKPAMKSSLLIALLVIPYDYGKRNHVLEPYTILKQFDSPIYQPYIDALHWLMVVEGINYNYFYTPLKNSGIFSSIMKIEVQDYHFGNVAKEATGLVDKKKTEYLKR